MKWIEDLPDDFTQDFRFTVTGVDDPHTWLTNNLDPYPRNYAEAERNWGEIVTLTRDEILRYPMVQESMIADDLKDTVIQWEYWAAHELEGGIASRGCCIVNSVIRRVSFGGQSMVALPRFSHLTGLTSLDLSGCEALTDVSGLSGLTGLTSLDLSLCEALTDVSGLSGLTGLTSLDLSGCEALTDVSGLSGLTGLTSLHLSWCSSLTHVSGLSGLTGLTSLYLMTCEALTDVSGLSGLTGLTSLYLRGCSSLTHVSGLSGLTGLTSLDLCSCEALTDVSGLSGLTGLTSLDLSSCEALTDVSGLSGLTGLTSLDLSNCPYVDHAGNRDVIAGLDNLKELDGIGEPFRTQLLWNAARRREAFGDLSSLLERMHELLASPMSNASLRADFIAGLSVLTCSDEQMGQIHALDWNREEWARLLVETDNRLDPVGSGPQFGINIGSGRIVIFNAMKGYILSVAEGARWEGHEAVLKEAFGHINSGLNKEGVELHPSWDEGVVDLLMALRETGMTQEHDTLFKAVTDQSRQAFDQQLRIQAAEAALDGGRWSDALQHMRDLPSRKESQLMDRLIPHVVGDEVPEAVLDWMETAADHDLGMLVANTGMTPAEGLRNRGIRETLFWLSASNAAMFRELVGKMFAAFPDDPWVAALMTEANPGLASSASGAEAAGGIRESLQSETLTGLLGPMVSQQLQTAVEGQSEVELHRLAVALLLEHFGAVTPQFRESILTALQSENPTA